MSPNDAEAAIDIAKQLDPDKGAQIEQAYTEGDVGLAVIWITTGEVGCHDYNTLAVRRGASPTVAGVALLHEWEHLENCEGGPSEGGTTGDGRVNDPCYDCLHGMMSLWSLYDLSSLICELPWYPPTPGYADICSDWDSIEFATRILSSSECLLGSCLDGAVWPPFDPSDCALCDHL